MFAVAFDELGCLRLSFVGQNAGKAVDRIDSRSGMTFHASAKDNCLAGLGVRFFVRTFVFKWINAKGKEMVVAGETSLVPPDGHQFRIWPRHLKFIEPLRWN